MRQCPSSTQKSHFQLLLQYANLFYYALEFKSMFPSGPSDSLRDLAQSPGSDSGAAWVDQLQLPACRDYNSHLARLGQLCSLLVTPDQLPRRPQPLLSSLFCVSSLQDDVQLSSYSREEKQHIWINNNVAVCLQKAGNSIGEP